MQKQDNSTVLNARQGKKSNDCTKNELFDSLGKIFIYLGMRGQNLPDKYEITIFADYIRENLTEFTIDEIELAFKMYIANKLDFRVPTFQNFTINFLENVMQSYKRLRMTIPRPTPAALPEKTPPTKEEQDIIAKNACLKRFEEYKDHFDVWDFGSACFHYLKKRGLIKLTKEQAEIIMEQARRRLIHEAQKEIGKKVASDIMVVVENLKNGTHEDRVRAEARKLSLMNYFDELIEKGIELKEVLK